MNYLKFTEEKLNVEAITELASSTSCGAISVFVGTTRDNFDDKAVVKLEYEAYESMGIRALEKICSELRERWPNVENIAIYHRLGTVPVKEASIVIAISSPHRKDAIHATEWCIDDIKKNVPIWKKEVYDDGEPQWKENKESVCCPKMKKLKFDFEPKVQVPYVPPHLVQIKASNAEINKRIENFMAMKRSEINLSNIRDFCVTNRDAETTCARVDAVLRKRNDSKGHLQVNRVLTSYHRDQMNLDYLTQYIPSNGVEERLENLEAELSLTAPVPKNIYARLKKLEDRMLYLESISPEYSSFWDKSNVPKNKVAKKVFSVQEIDAFIADLEKKTPEDRGKVL